MKIYSSFFVLSLGLLSSVVAEGANDSSSSLMEEQQGSHEEGTPEARLKRRLAGRPQASSTRSSARGPAAATASDGSRPARNVIRGFPGVQSDGGAGGGPAPKDPAPKTRIPRTRGGAAGTSSIAEMTNGKTPRGKTVASKPAHGTTVGTASAHHSAGATGTAARTGRGGKPQVTSSARSSTTTSTVGVSHAPRGGSKPQKHVASSAAVGPAERENAKRERAAGTGGDHGQPASVASQPDPAGIYYWDDDRFWSNEYCGPDEIPAILFLDTGGYSDEIGFALIDVSAPEEPIALSYYGELFDYTSYNGQICLPADACYEFYLFDWYGDGFDADGGLYLDFGGFNVMDIRPQSIGTFVDSESNAIFYGAAFGVGENCGFGDIYTAPLITLEDPDGFWDDDLDDYYIVDDVYLDTVLEAPRTIEGTNGNSGTCSGQDVLVEMFFYTDYYSIAENEVFLHDINAPDYIWEYRLGSFKTYGTEFDENNPNPDGADYYFNACLDPNKCYSFEFVDVWGDFELYPLAELYFYVDGVTELELSPDEYNWITTPSDVDPPPSGWIVEIGNCG